MSGPASMDIPDHFHFSHRRMVEFADTDVAGIMHFSNFFRFVESAEHAYFRSLGFRVHTSSNEAHQGWPRIEVSCKYLRPARFEQTLEICLRIDEVRTSSLSYSYWIFAAEEPQRSLLANGSFSIVHVELDTKAHAMRKAPIPPTLRQRLESTIASTPSAPHTRRL
jgi:YbgC/YbaW family acyl-CoA thioester hydrolase